MKYIVKIHSLAILHILSHRNYDTICYWRTQSYDFDLQRQHFKFYNATGSLARFENKNIIFFFEKRSSLLQCWHCSCKFKSRRNWLQVFEYRPMVEIMSYQDKIRINQQVKNRFPGISYLLLFRMAKKHFKWVTQVSNNFAFLDYLRHPRKYYKL
jgi:hypothetical protein